MGVVEALIRHRPARPVEIARVAAALRANRAAGLAALVRLARTLEERAPAPSARLDALESLRPAWVATVEPTVAALRNRPIPLAPDELAAFHRLALALRALRDAWLRLHVDLREAHPDGSSAPSGPDARRALARALDAQSRLLVAACRLRIALPRDDWDALCRLAFPLWSADALDERPEAGASGPGGDAPSPRAALVVPLLMRLLEPLGLGGAALELAFAIARHAGRRAGVRIDVDGLPHVGADGPALMLSAHHTVRLDTRDALQTLARCRARLAEGASPASVGLRTWLSPAAVDALLGGLQGCWAPRRVPTPLVRPPLPRALLRVGLPSAAEPGAAPVIVDDRTVAAPAADAIADGRRLYRYGRRTAGGPVAGGFEFARVAPATPPPAPSPEASVGTRDDAARAVMESDGEPVEWRGRDARRAVFARTAAAPRLRLGDVVAVLPVHAARGAARRRPGSGPTRPMVGRVVTLAQTGAADGRAPAGHDVGVEFWPGAAVPVRVRIGDAIEPEGAWWLPGGADDPPSLVLPPDRFAGPVDVVVGEPAGERRMRLLRLIDRGPGHDRVELGPPG